MPIEGEPRLPSREELKQQIEDLEAMIEDLEGKADEETINELKGKKGAIEADLEKLGDQ